MLLVHWGTWAIMRLLQAVASPAGLDKTIFKIMMSQTAMTERPPLLEYKT